VYVCVWWEQILKLFKYVAEHKWVLQKKSYIIQTITEKLCPNMQIKFVMFKRDIQSINQTKEEHCYMVCMNPVDVHTEHVDKYV
jgi:hypothetical protein